MPDGVITTTSFAPTAPAGVTAVIEVALTTTTLVAATPPIFTLVAPVKLVPVMVIAVPPLNTPEFGITDAMVGNVAFVYVNAPTFVAVPPAVVTERVLAPAVPAGVTAVICVPVPLITMLVTATPSMVTLLAALKFVPLIVMSVPPASTPVFGFTEVMVGAGNSNVNAFKAVAIPAGVVTTTDLAPEVRAGVIAVMEVSETTTTLVAATPPKVTLVAPVKCAPEIVTVVPPRVVPDVGLNDAIVGAGISYVNALTAVALPNGVVTDTSC